MEKAIEITEAVQRFVSYVKMGWKVDESFEIAYDSVFDLVEKEKFLDKCQNACKEMNAVIYN